jgi:CheY-like chemotaxis protein
LGEQCTLRLVTDPTPVICWADGLQLENALVNLALNARDAMPSGGTVFVGVQRTTLTATAMLVRQGEVQSGSYAQLLITDTGVGMTPKVQAQAFDPFFTTKPYAGTGLGLSTVYGFVRQSQGAISLHSAPGAGTTVRILLPLGGKAADGGHEPGEGAGAPLFMTAASPRRGTILVVDPSADVGQVAARLLRDLNYACQLASDAHTALAQLGARPDIAVLMTDIALPGGMPGSALAKQVRSRFPEVALLLTTAHMEPVDPALEAAFTVLRKPFKRSVLAAALTKIHSKRLSFG